LALRIALEHTDEGDNYTSAGSTRAGPLGVAGEVTYAGDMFNAEIAGFLRDADSNGSIAGGGKVTQSQIGLGLGATCPTCSTCRLLAAWATTSGIMTAYRTASSTRQVANQIGDGWEAQRRAVATLSDSVSAELGAGFSSYDDDTVAGSSTETMAIAGGVYWSPVSQLKMGVQASWVDIDNTERCVNAILI
jgi:hypothetical protein